MAISNKPITNLDFQGVKASFIEYLKTQTQFKDYNFEGSNMSVFLDVLAYNTFQNNYYTNMAINEMFLDSAVMPNSIVSHAKELNYLPRSRKSARATVTVTIYDDEVADSIIEIPKYTSFVAEYAGNQYDFLTDQVHVAKRTSSGVYQTEEITLLEGSILQTFEREGFIVDENGVLKVALSNDTVDTDSIEVFVDAEATEDQNIFVRKDDIYGVGATDKVFYLEAYFDNRYAIYFGNNKFGLQPETFEDVRVRYRVCSGAEPNGASSFTAGLSYRDPTTEQDRTLNATVETVSAAAGGSDRESMESIRYYAPKSLQIQERAVTTRDYEILLKQRFPEIKAVAAYGGEDLNPPQFGKVAISIYLQNGGNLLSSNLASVYGDFLSDKSPLGIEAFFINTDYVYADITANVYFTRDKTTKSSAEIEKNTRAVISKYVDDNLEDFNKTLRVSQLAKLITEDDISIESVELEVNPIIDYVPTLNVKDSPTFQFKAELVKPYPYRNASGFSDYKPAVLSSAFDYGSVCSRLYDDGIGNIMIVTDEATPKVLKPKIGTVDYTTGEIKLTNFEVTDFTGSAISIHVTTKRRDVKAPLGRVFLVRDTDVKVQVAEAKK